MKYLAGMGLRKTAVVLVLLLLLPAGIAFSLTGSQSLVNSGTIYYPPEAQVLLSDEFDAGDFSVWNGLSVATGDIASVSSTMAYEGTFGAYFATGDASSATKYAYCYRDVSPVVSEIYARAYFLISEGLPLDDADDRFGLLAFEVGGQLQCTFRIVRSGGVDKFNVIGFDGASSVSVSTDSIYPVEGKWYCIEFYVKVDSTAGAYRAWINGVEQISVVGVNTASYGSGVTRVRCGLTSTIGVQHGVRVRCDSVVISTGYVGQLRYRFGIIGSVSKKAAVNNFIWLFGNESISYRVIDPSEVTRFEDADRFDGLVVWTAECGVYDASAIREFADSRVVIADVKDFCLAMYPTVSKSMQVVSTSTVNYVVSWGPFSSGDVVDMRNETGNVDQLTVVQASALGTLPNVVAIAKYDSTRTAFFRMKGTETNSGFYVMDLDATTPETKWTGIWHIFTAVKRVQDFPTGEYARWMANGTKWYDLAWVYNRINEIVNANGDIARKISAGKSVQGRDIPAILIGSGSKYAIVDGDLHGNEKTGTFSCLRLAELLTAYYRSSAYWKSKMLEYTFVIVPVVNPDGFVLNIRENANDVDLNGQFPPDGSPTEPEALALMSLMSKYPPTIYVNCHEGWYWYTLDMLCGNYETSANKALTFEAMRSANDSFVGLNHYGWFTDNGWNVPIGKVRAIYPGGKQGMSVAYASYQYHASCMLLETFVWSQTYGARQSLWGLDYYPAVILSFIQNLQR